MKKILMLFLALNGSEQPHIVIDINEFHNHVCENAITVYFKSPNHGMYSRLSPFLRKKLSEASSVEHETTSDSFHTLITESIEEAFLDREQTIQELKKKKKIIAFANLASAIIAGSIVFIAEYFSREC